MQTGFFVSHRLNKGDKGLREVVSGLQRLVECRDVASVDGRSFKQLLEEEIEEYKNTAKFVKHSSHRSILFLENRSRVSTLGLFYRLREADTRFEYVYRVVPLERFFRYSSRQVIESVGELDRTRTYRILYEERLCSDGMKEAVFESITGALCMKVDLVDPHYTIVVQGFKDQVGISVVENEKENFNFSSLQRHGLDRTLS